MFEIVTSANINKPTLNPYVLELINETPINIKQTSCIETNKNKTLT